MVDERRFAWHWSTFRRPMPVVFGDEAIVRMWGGIYGLKIGFWFFGVTRAWSPAQERQRQAALKEEAEWMAT